MSTRPINLFEDLDKSFTDDPEWNTFWEKVKNEEGAKDKDIEYLKIQTLISYRFKLMSNAMFSIQMNKDFSPEEKKQAKNVLSVLQIFNGKYDGNKENLAEATKTYYHDQSATNYAQDINIAIKKGIEMKKAGTSDEDIRKEMSLLREKTFIANKNGDNYALFYGDEGAKKVFDEYFTVDGMLEKVNQYNKVCEAFGFDVNERMKELTDFREKHKELIGNDNKNEIDDLVRLTKRMAYFSESQLEHNDDVNKIPSMEERIQAKDELNKKLESSLLKAVSQGNMDVVHDFAKVGFTTDKKTNEYKRGFFNAIKDGFKDFPKNLNALFNKPSRTITEISKISGRNDIVGSIEKAAVERKEIIVNNTSTQVNKKVGELDLTLSKKMPANIVDQKTKPHNTLITKLFSGKKAESKQRRKEQVEMPPEPTVSKYLEDINALLKEVEKEENKVDKSDTHQIKLIAVEKNALTQAKSELEKLNLASPESMNAFSKNIKDILDVADQAKKDINNGMNIDDDLSSKRSELLRDAREQVRTEVSRSEKRGPSTKQGGR